jgi:hypothetical protein
MKCQKHSHRLYLDLILIIYKWHDSLVFEEARQIELKFTEINSPGEEIEKTHVYELLPGVLELLKYTVLE